uniref:hypothetical protein n=1 Tax=Candidatus Ichthyocystis sparus TaxID=1561004 RepID=UPI00114762CD
MYPVPTTSSAASNDVLEGEDSGRSNEEEEATANIGIVEGGLQQVEAPVTDSAATALTAATTVGKGGGSKSKGKSSAKKRDVAAVSSSTTTAVTGKGASTKGKASAEKCVTAAVSPSVTTLDPNVLGSLGVTLSPDSVQIVSSLFNEIAELSRCICNKMLDRQLPSIV